jgi:hypothetical protein
MASTGGANTVVDGLVFGYDTGYPLVSGNLDTYKFNRGEPTENQISQMVGSTDFSYPEVTYRSTATETNVSDSTAPGGKYSRFTGIDDSSNNQLYSRFNTANIDVRNSTITYSVYLKGSGTCHLTIYADNIGYGTSSTITLTNKWTRYTYTRAVTNYTTNCWVAVRGVLNTTDVYIASQQAEIKSHTTPFTTGTRSATESLIDLTRTTNIDLSNVSFDSNAQMTFDGTDDRATYTTPHDDSVTELTYELVFKGSRGEDYTYILHNNGQDITTGNSFCTFGWLGSTDNIYGSFNGHYSSMYDTTTTIDSNKYYHLTLVWNGSTQKFYINGVEKKSMNLGSIVKTLSTTTSIGGEKNAAHRMMTGTVPLVKTYTRALSAQEVLQNYNALKERFSL